MNLSAAIELRSEGRELQAAGLKQDNRFQPVHAGAHAHFTKIGYIHTGNKTRGGVTTSNYFKTKGGNSRHVAVQADGSYMKTSRTAKGEKRNKGKLDAKGMKCHNVSEEMKPDRKREEVKATGEFEKGAPVHSGAHKMLLKEGFKHIGNKDGRSGYASPKGGMHVHVGGNGFMTVAPQSGMKSSSSEDQGDKE